MREGKQLTSSIEVPLEELPPHHHLHQMPTSEVRELPSVSHLSQLVKGYGHMVAAFVECWAMCSLRQIDQEFGT